ncbi:MAG: ABC transporter permease [Candidatus Saccharibacteria bacterium]
MRIFRSVKRINSIVWKEFIQFSRDSASLMLAFVLPVFLLMVFGYAATLDIDHIQMAVFDGCQSAESRKLVAFFEQSGYFVPEAYARSAEEVETMIDKGEVKCGMIIAPDFDYRMQHGEPAQVQMLIDGQDPLVSGTALNISQILALARSGQIMQERLGNTLNGGTGPFARANIDLRPQILYNPDRKTLDLYIPGMIAMIMQSVTVFLTAFALLRERERGNFEQLLITPLRPYELVLGKLFPYIVVGFIEFVLVLAVSVFWFKVQMAGSLFVMFALYVLFLASSLALGMLVASICQNQLQSLMLMIAILLTALILSGFVFPRESMPRFCYWLGGVLPITY